MRIAFPSLKVASAGMKRSLGVALMTATLMAQTSAMAMAAEKYAALVIDANNGRVLFSKNADDLRYPASLTKMMTLYLLFESLRDGRNTLSTPMQVSAYAAARPPSKLGLKPGSTITVQEAIFGLVTKSANDAAVVIGEHLAGTEQRFAQQMTAKARQLGMSRTTFRNANGLPNDAQMTTARDMATLGIALREHFPQEFAYFKTKSFNFRGRTIGSHNRLVGRIDGVDGIKTGYVNASGFNLVSSLMRGDKKLVGVVFGGKSGAARDNNMAELLTRALPQASTKSTGPLLAAATARQGRVHPQDAVEIETARYEVPDTVPVPSPGKRLSINERISRAYGSDAGEAIARMAGATSAKRTVVGRDALREALITPRPQDASDDLAIPTANSLAPLQRQPMKAAPAFPVPPGEIPGAKPAFDPQTTGSVADNDDLAAPTSAWIVQIAAMPDRSRALAMLEEAKARSGSALLRAKPFTQAVTGGAQTLHRARFAGFDTKSQATAACAALKRQSYNCYAVAN